MLKNNADMLSARGGWNAENPDVEALRKYAADETSRMAQSFGNQKAQDVYQKTAPEQTLVSEAIDRLAKISACLGGASTRIETVAERVLGSVPVGSNTADASGKGCAGSADALLGILDRLALQVERLHDVASRVERIG